MFNFKHTRGCDCVKITFTPTELSQKPIKYWANVGRVNKNGRFQKIISTVKKITGDPTGNGIEYLHYYAGSRLLFPFHVHWMEDCFELAVYNCFGDGKGKLLISRKVKSNNERFTPEEVKKISDFIRLQYHIVQDGYNFINSYMSEAKDLYDVHAKILEMKTNIETNPTSQTK